MFREATAVRELDLEGYLDYMERGESGGFDDFPDSVASIRALYQYLLKVNGIVAEGPVRGICRPPED